MSSKKDNKKRKADTEETKEENLESDSKKSTSYKDIFKGYRFIFSGRLSKNVTEFESLIKKHGSEGTINTVNDENAKKTIVVAKKEHFKWDKIPAKVKSALDKNVILVDESWLSESASQNTFLATDKYLIKKPTAASSDVSASSTKPIEANNNSNNNSTPKKPAEPLFTVVEEEEEDPNKALVNPMSQGSQTSQTTMPEKSDSKANLDAIYSKHKNFGFEHGGDESIDAIQGMGLVSLADDMGVSSEDIVMMILLWKINSKVQYTVTRSEFLNGLRNLGVNNMGQLRDKIPLLRNEVKDKKNFQSLYTFYFNYVKDPAAKSLPCATAVEAWKSLITKDKFKWISEWCDFVTNNNKAIQFDTWNQFLNFIDVINASGFSSYDDDGAFPSLFDDFVSSLKK